MDSCYSWVVASGRVVLKVTGRALAIVVVVMIGLFAGWRGLLLVGGEVASIRVWSLLGGLGLCLLALGFVGLGFRLILPRSRHRREWIVTGAAVVAHVGLTVLAVAWMYHDYALVGSLAGGVAALAPAAVILFLAHKENWYLAYVDRGTWIVATVALILFEGSTISLAVTSSQRGHPVPAWIFGPAAGLPVIVPVLLLLLLFLRALFNLRGRGPAAPFSTQLAGLAVPVGSVVAARVLRSGNPVHGTPAAFVAALGAIALVTVAAFVVQQFFLGWLAVESSGGEQGERHYRRLSDLEDLYQGELRAYRRRGYSGWKTAIARPVMTSDLAASSQRTASRTGLVLDEVWPRIELVLPAEVRKPFRRADRSVEALRVATASAAATALAWALIALGWSGGRSGMAGTVTAIVGPLFVAAVSLASLRQRVTRLYQQRADAVDLYRFDLARSLQLPIPRDPDQFRAVAGVLMGRSRPDELVPSGGPQPAEGPPVSPEQFDGLREHIISEINTTLLPEIRQLERQQTRLADLVQNPVLDREQLSALADLVADRTTEPVAENVRERLEALQQSFYQRVGKLIEEGIESSVLGPPLVNFTGFMVIDLKKGGQGRPSRERGEMISAPVGGLLELSFFLINDENARGAAPTLESGDQFFVVEPIRIDGGRAAGIVEFAAVADSPTLKPEPNRRSITVVGQAATETIFSFRMPDKAGRHEIWFQLYQAGRLVQAVTVHVQARQEPASVKG